MTEIEPVKPLLGTSQREALESDRSYLTEQLTNPLVTDKPTVLKNLRRVEHDIETQSPPELTGDALDKEVRLEKELRESIVPDMLSQEEMRKAPAGSVGRHLAFEKKHKNSILRWKNAMRTIHRGSDDPDIANLERFRPTVSTMGMHDVLIQGRNFDFPSQKYLEGYDGIDWSKHDRAEGEDMESFKSRVRRGELAEMRAKLDALEDALTAPSVEPEAGEHEKAPSRLGLEEES